MEFQSPANCFLAQNGNMGTATKEWFPSVAGTMISLFGATTGGLDWIEVHRLLEPLGTFAQSASRLLFKKSLFLSFSFVFEVLAEPANVPAYSQILFFFVFVLSRTAYDIIYCNHYE